MTFLNKTSLASLLTAIISTHAYAGADHASTSPLTHAPIGVMGDHLHKEGEFMMSYRFMDMAMEDNLQGSNNISADTIATTTVNPFAHMSMMPMPITTRVVPKKMNSQMHMLGLMYAPSDDLTLMLMLNYLEKDMTLTTYKGMQGKQVLADFSSSSAGLSDSKVGLLYRLYDNQHHHFHLNFNWQIPTGDTKKTGIALTPMNQQMAMRLPYAMQMGTGSNHLEIGATYNAYLTDNSWGVQILHNQAIDTNKHNYRVGDKNQLSAWYAHKLHQQVSSSIRVTYQKTGSISGIDTKIMAPVHTANPKNSGRKLLNLGLGINTVIFNKHRIAFEYEIPLQQDVEGVQMKMSNMLTLGYQLAF